MVPCPACGVATTSPWPTDQELDAAYGGWYRPEGGRFSGPGDAILARARARLALRIDSIAPPGAVLDVGAGDGTLVDALARTGRNAVGIEREPTRPDLRAAEVTDVDEPFAAVVFWHSLEHLREPLAALRHAASLLVPGGVIVVAAPNAGSLQAQLFGRDWFALDMPRHLVHIPAPVLVAGLGSAGMRVERESHLRGGQVLFGWLHGLVKRVVPGHPDLYDAIRRPGARSEPMGAGRRAATLVATVALLPVAAVATAMEVALRRGGTVYLEARRG